MVTKKTGSEQRAKFQKRVALKPELMEEICEHVSEGGTLITLAKKWDVSYGTLTNWIHADKAREQRYLKALNDREEWSKERILQELRTIGLVDIRDLINEEGGLRPKSEWPEEVSRSISSIEITELREDGEGIGEVKKIRLNDKIKALELVGKNLRLFTDKVELSGQVTLADLVTASQKKEDK
jgi:hypothetical protein